MSLTPNTHTLQKKHLWIFTGIWFLLNVLQAYFTELAHDEAYYWVYAREMDIGYYDHPPMIAAMIAAGGWLFKGELGVRFFSIVFSALSIPVLYSLCGKKDLNLFIFLVLGWTSFQVYGFIAVPDSPLLFFTILFFLAYREYEKQDSWKNTLLTATVIALLLYSKYHGLLVVFFTVVSNFALLRRKTFYAIIVMVGLMYLPHILWQVTNDYPSYQYHILNKSQSPYNVLDSVEFLGATVGVAGPLTGILMIYAFVRSRGGDRMLRAMRFTFIGFVAFFFLSTFNSRIEANWMAAATVPLVVVAHGYISERRVLRKWTIGLALVSAIIFSFVRLNLMTDIVPAAGSKMLPEFYGWKKWAQTIKANANGCPVVLMNSYARASKYSFYTDSEGLSLDNIAYRRNQYDIWDIADSMQGKKIALYRTWDQSYDSLPVVETNIGRYSLFFIDNFRSFTKVNITTDKDWYTFPHAAEIEIPLQFFMQDGKAMKTEPISDYPVSLVCTRFYFSEYDTEIHLMNLDSAKIENGSSLTVKMRTPDKPGPYYLRFCIRTGWLPPYINSRLIRMDVE